MSARAVPPPAEGARPIVLAITGASGAPYAIRLLERLLAAQREVALIISRHGLRLLATECGVSSVDALRSAVGAAAWDRCVRLYDDADRGAAPASGSARTGPMVICPCSMGTVSAISVGASRSLIERAADVALKEGRKLVVVPRESPLSAIHLENLLKLSRLGVVVLPAAPGFYHRPTRLDELVDFVVARILDHLGVPQSLVPRWSGEEPDDAG